MFLRLIVCTTLYLSTGLYVSGQTGQVGTKTIATSMLTINDGLSQGMVHDIIQDRNGFLWIATKDGLNKYDGYTFKVYRNNPDHSNSISENHVTKLFEDSKGNIWIGSINGLIDKLDINTETFTHYLYKRNKNLLVQIFGFTELQDGTIAAKSTQILMINPLSGRVDSLALSKKTEAEFILTKKLILTTEGTKIFIKNYQDKALATRDLADDIKPYINENAITIYNSVKAIRSAYFHSATYDSINNLIHIVFNSGLISIDAHSLQTKWCIPTERIINGISIIRENVLWIVVGGKLIELDYKKKSITSLVSRDESYLNDDVSSICKDRTGIFWIGTRGYGLMKYNPRNEIFNNTPFKSISGMAVIDGNLLVGHVPDLYQYDITKKQIVKSFTVPQSKVLGFSRTGHPPAIDRLGNYWSSEGQDLIVIDKKTKERTRYHLPVLDESFYDVVHCLAFDASGYVWLGTETGLLRLNPKDSSVKIFKNIPTDYSSISINSVYSLCPDQDDKKNILWVGTNGGGLNKFDLTTGKSVRFTTANGLPNNVIYGILQDSSGSLWMSTNLGLARFDPETSTCTNYTINDGLQSNEFNRYAYTKSSEGYFFFGGVKGFNYFKPADVKHNDLEPLLAITDIYVGNKPLRELDTNVSIPKVLYTEKLLTLPYSRNLFSIHFAALDFAAANENQYKYRLLGFSNEWVDLGTQNSATFTNLDPGTYTFQIIAKNKYGTWNTKGANLTIKILPPWYKTWWFRLVVIALMWFLVWMIYRIRLNSALKVMKIRDDIARDLHDEIGSNLSNISIFSNVASAYENSTKTKALLRKISNYAQYSQASMQDIIWMISTNNDSFEQTISRMKLYANDVFDSLECKLNLNFDESIKNMKINMEDRKNLYLLFKEGINNIAKHANCTEANISMFKNGNLLVLQITDNGVGIDPKTNNGNGLVNLKNRASALGGDLQIFSSKEKGTMINLSFDPNH